MKACHGYEFRTSCDAGLTDRGSASCGLWAIDIYDWSLVARFVVVSKRAYSWQVQWNTCIAAGLEGVKEAEGVAPSQGPMHSVLQCAKNSGGLKKAFTSSFSMLPLIVYLFVHFCIFERNTHGIVVGNLKERGHLVDLLR
jgi:hypothetical protein